jgi:hypothetical protein
MFSLLSATVGLAHATLGLAASQAALNVLSVSDAVLGQAAGDARPAVLSSKTNKCTAIVPWVAEEPVGPEKLRQLFQTAVLN